MVNKGIKFFAFSIILLISSFSIAQLPVPFKVRYQSYVKGDMHVIANSIVNRKDISNSPEVPYMNATKTAKLNDEFSMFYIDVDKDPSTFSSSSATLKLPNSADKKIVYAGLYWSATYKYNSGEVTSKQKFKAIDKKRDATIDKIKIKLPGAEKYLDIKGTIIFDGINDKDFKESAPYAAYADITKLVSQLENPYGEYTIANIKATQGVVEGGVAGGWTLFFVYEDPMATGKFITSFDGFAGVTDKATEILFTGFKTLPNGTVVAKLASAALEGDCIMTGDQLQINSGITSEFTLLSHALKPENNFFNSSIVLNDSYFTDRVPNSKNTLGYDTSLITIANPNNTVIQNNTNQVTLRLKSHGDRYYMFFNAFNVEVLEPIKTTNPDVTLNATTNKSNSSLAASETKVEIKKPNTIVAKSEVMPETKTTSIAQTNPKDLQPKIKKDVTVKENSASIVEQPTNDSKASKSIINTKEEVSSPKVAQTSSSSNTLIKSTQLKENVIDHPKVKPNVSSSQTKVNPLEISEKLSNTIAFNGRKRDIAVPSPPISLESINEGCYIVAGVFAVHTNAIRFMNSLRSQGLNANFFVNPKNNYRYIYLSKHNSWTSALKLYYSNVEGKYFGEIWIMVVNTTYEKLLKDYNYSNTDFVTNYTNNKEGVLKEEEI